MSLRDHRYKLVAAEARLRELKITLDFTKASVEHDLIEKAGGEKALGANEAARERELEIGRGLSDAYQKAQNDWLVQVHAVALLEADILTVLDDRRDRELAQRDRLIAVLETAGGLSLLVKGMASTNE